MNTGLTLLIRCRRGLTLKVEEGTPTVSGTPTTRGHYPVVYIVTDVDGDTASDDFVITVVGDDAPEFAAGASIKNQLFKAGVAIDSDPDED